MNGNPDGVDRREMQLHRAGHRCREKINRASGVMAERRTDLAIVVRQGRRRVAARRAGRQNGRRAARRERERMVVPTEQRGLEKERKNAEKRSLTARRRRFRLANPIP